MSKKEKAVIKYVALVKYLGSHFVLQSIAQIDVLS